MAGLLIFCWFARGPDHPVYGLLVVGWTLVLGPVVAAPVMRRVPRHWFRVPAGESVLHLMLGVGVFRWLLERSGWERHVHKREFHATRTGLPCLELALRSNASAHGTCFAVHILFAAFALFIGHPWGALWILLPGVIVHLYPVLLQRSIMLRLQPLLNKSGSWVHKETRHIAIAEQAAAGDARNART
jgi:hypothetical protein